MINAVWSALGTDNRFRPRAIYLALLSRGTPWAGIRYWISRCVAELETLRRQGGACPFFLQPTVSPARHPRRFSVPRVFGNDDSVALGIVELDLIRGALGNRDAIGLETLLEGGEIVHLDAEVLDAALRPHLRLGQ